MLTDDELTTMLTDAYQDATAGLTPSAGLAAAVRHRYATVHRRQLVATVATPVAAATAVGAVALWSGSVAPVPARAPLAESQPPTHTPETEAADPGTIRLAGYTFVLPAAFLAQSGSCEATAPDGSKHHGTPGADDACVAIWLSKERPSWVPSTVPDSTATEGSIIATLVDPSQKTPTVSAAEPLPAAHGGGYVVAALQLAPSPPRSIAGGGVSLTVLRHVLEKATNGAN